MDSSFADLEELVSRNPPTHRSDDVSIVAQLCSKELSFTEEQALAFRKQIINQLYKISSILSGSLDQQYALSLLSFLRRLAKDQENFSKELVVAADENVKVYFDVMTHLLSFGVRESGAPEDDARSQASRLLVEVLSSRG